MKRVRWALAAAIGLWIISGCRLFLGSSTLTVINDSTYEIINVYISRVVDDDWGPDRLKEKNMIVPRGSADYELFPGDYDILLQEYWGDVWVFWDVNLPQDGFVSVTCTNENRYVLNLGDAAPR